MMAGRQKAGAAPTVSIMIVIAGYALCNTAMSVLMNRIIDEYHLAGASQGLMNSMLNLGSFLAILAIPLIQGRVKKTVMITACALLQALMLALTGCSATFVLLLAACLVLGVGGGWADNYTNSCIVDIHPGDSARYMGMLHGFYGVGAVITPLLLQGLLYIAGWRQVYIIIAVVALMVALQFMAVSRRRREVFAQTSDSEQRLNFAHIKEFFSDKTALLVVVCLFFYNAGQNVLLGWLVRYMKVQHNAEALGALTVSLVWAAMTLSRFFAPRIRTAPIKLVAFGTGTAAVLHTVGILSGSAAVMVVVSALNGLVSGFCMPMLIHAGVSRFPGNTSLPTSVLMFGSKLAMTLMPLAVGAVAVFSLRLGMLLSAGCLLVSCVFAAVITAAGKEKAAG